MKIHQGSVNPILHLPIKWLVLWLPKEEVSTISSNKTGIFLCSSPQALIEYQMNPRWTHIMVSGLGRTPPPLPASWKSSISLSGWVGGKNNYVKRRTQSSWVKALYKCQLTKIKSMAYPRSEHNINLKEDYRCQGNQINWDPLKPISSWQTPDLLLLTSSLDSNRPTPDMRLTLISLVSRSL